MVNYWIEGLKTVFEPYTFLMTVVGVLAGVVVGALPGITSSMGIILLLPFTYYMDPRAAMMMIVGLYCSSMFGGSISAVLLRTPGTPSAAATALDGYPLAQKGKAGKALSAALLASFAGGMISSVALIFLSPVLAKFALQFGPAEYFSLAIFGLTMVASVSKGNLLKGLISGFLGLLLCCVGVDNVGGRTRLTFGINALTMGFDFLPVMIGAFAVAEVIRKLEKREESYVIESRISDVFLTREEMKDILVPILFGSLIGVIIGVIPATGGTIATFLAYNELRRWHKKGNQFGQGVLEGVAVCESANNAVTGGAMVPLFSLGIPGDAVTAVMLGAMILIGLRPGPLLFVERPDVVYTVFAGWFVVQFLMLTLGFLSIAFAPKILKIPPNILMPIILVLSIVGSYGLRNSMYDVTVALMFGFIGYIMERCKMPIAPMVLGIILGPYAEGNLNRALLISRNDWLIVFKRPISLVLLLAAFASIAFSLISSYREAKKRGA